jgi:hypothetical protein
MRDPRFRTSATALVLLALFALQSGCYTVYQPTASPRIQLRSDNVLVKDGKVVKSLAEAVRGDPAIEAEAKRGAHARSTGNVLFFSGLGSTLAAEITGIALTGGKKVLPPAAIATFVAGLSVWLVTSVIGGAYLIKASWHETNAINMHNDKLPPSPPCTATPPPPPAPEPR